MTSEQCKDSAASPVQADLDRAEAHLHSILMECALPRAVVLPAGTAISPRLKAAWKARHVRVVFQDD